MEKLNFTLNFDLDEVNLILGALGELPYKSVNSLIYKIKTDAEKQISMKNEPLTEVKPEAGDK
jgi:hypothetical protein